MAIVKLKNYPYELSHKLQIIKDDIELYKEHGEPFNHLLIQKVILKQILEGIQNG